MFRTLLTVPILLGLALSAAAQDEVEKLEKKIAELEARLKKLKKDLNLAKRKNDPTEACATNLSQLWKMQANYMVQFGGVMKSMPIETGRDFWLKLSQTSPPLIDKTLKDIYFCPASTDEQKFGTTNYRGPARNVNVLADGDVVGCCEPGHHADGKINVLRKSGDVVTIGPKDKLYKKALKGTIGDSNVAKIKQCKALIENLRQAIKNYEFDQAMYPDGDNADMVKALQSLGPKKLPYFEFQKKSLNKKGEILDPWGKPLVYRRNYPDPPKDAKNKTSFDMYSFGPNGKDEIGGGDDLNNWD